METNRVFLFASVLLATVLATLFSFSILSEPTEEEPSQEYFGDSSPEDVLRLGIRDKRYY